MRRYFTFLLVLSLALAVVSFAMLWANPGHFIMAMPLLVLYFAAVTAVQHWIVVRAMSRSPKAFVQVFLGSTIAALMLHLVVIAAYLLGGGLRPKLFLIAFFVCYVAYLAFETIALVRYVDGEKKRRRQQQTPPASESPAEA